MTTSDLDRLLAEACLDRGSTRLLPAPPTELDGALGPVLAQAVHTSRASVLVTDTDLDEPGPRILYANPAFESMTGYTATEVLGRNPRFLQGPSTSRAVLDRLRHDLETLGTFEGEAVNYRADGTPFVMSWRIAAVSGPGGDMSHFVAIQDDVTEERMRTLADRRLVADLQSSLLPQLPPRIGSLELAASYRPATPGAPVGGDWYDALESADGSISLVVGDVAGSGAEAAAAMGRLRWSTHALLAAGTELDRVAHVVSQLAAKHDLFATVAVARIQPDGHVDVLTAGHPPVVVLRPGGLVDPMLTPNPMLGLLPDLGGMEVTSTTLGEGDVLLLYSDGVVDGGRIPIDEVPAELAARIGHDLAGDLDTICAAVTSGASARDDAAVLAARRR